MEKKDDIIDFGIIGGTGVYDSSMMKNTYEIDIDTPFGHTSDKIIIGNYLNKSIAFLPRHGRSHQYPPHKVPYKANIWAFKKLGVQRIIAPSAVGSLNENLVMGNIVLPDQFIDLSKNRNYTFYDDQAVHVSMAEPYCNDLRSHSIKTAKNLGIEIKSNGTYVSIEGPRFSTKAESLFYKNVMKGDIIGMTAIPEAILAREMEMCYMTLATVTDYDAWETKHVSADMVSDTMKKSVDKTKTFILSIIDNTPKERNCECMHSLENARL
ncbi:MAG: S-methyl-5'-thioadenosine phosphorylase [Candidatus Marsarchaeota archaeon]|nr:S-methyl-5'-thioadenosine phosphorylase [Candidatus Marsarchaeota archaeon]